MGHTNGTEYRLASSAFAYAPGLIEYAQALYAEGNEKAALKIISAWDGLPVNVAIDLAEGKLKTRIDDDESLIVIVD